MSIKFSEAKVAKASIVNKLNEVYTSNEFVVLLNYKFSTSASMHSLRKAIYESKMGTKLFVVKNTLTKVALKDMKFNQDMSSHLKDQIATLANNDLILLAKTLESFVSNKAFNINLIGIFFKNGQYDLNEIKKIAALPSFDVLRGQLLSLLQSPMQKVTQILAEPVNTLVRIGSLYSKSSE